MNILTETLDRFHLDYAVALVLGYSRYPDDPIEKGEIWHESAVRTPFSKRFPVGSFRPSMYAFQGMKIMEMYKIGVVPVNGEWGASPQIDYGNITCYQGFGDTPLIAAMRALVWRKYGSSIELPDDIEKLY